MQRRGFFVAHGRAGGFHARAQFLRQIPMPAFQEQAHVAHGLGVSLVRSQALHARPQAAMNVKLQARMRVHARQIHLAGRNFEVAMDEVHQPVRQIPRKVRTEVTGAVLQAPRHIDARILLRRELDVRIGLVVAQQDVEARLPLLDEVVLERQRFFFVVDLDEVDLPRVVDQRAGLESASRSSEK